MLTLKGDNVFLRALEPEDLEFVYQIENDENNWEISNTKTPYSQYILKAYLKNAHKDIFEAKQLRLVISDYNYKALGLIDIFDFDFSNKKAGVGILIKDTDKRQMGYGGQALKLLINYCFTHLGLHQLYCNITEDNTASLKLFKKFNFEIIGLKKDWIQFNNEFKNEYLLQLISTL